MEKSVDNPVSELLKRHGLVEDDLEKFRDTVVNARIWRPGVPLILERVARLLDALDAEMNHDPEWADPACNTNFHDARALLAAVLP